LWSDQGKQRHQLLVITLFSLTLCVVLLISYVRLAHSSRFVPFLYIVDRSGEVLALGGAKPLPADSDGTVYYSLATFITNLRAVYSDPLAERAALKSAYVYLPGDNPDARSKPFLEAYMSDHDPRVLSQSFSRTAEIVSLLKLPNRQADKPSKSGVSSIWRVRWRETTYPISTGISETTEWEAFATVRLHPKRIVESFDPNPFGVYVDQLNWSRVSPATH
jgi:type IV secretion system protein VirB5